MFILLWFYIYNNGFINAFDVAKYFEKRCQVIPFCYPLTERICGKMPSCFINVVWVWIGHLGSHLV